jgi:hypothetical protein
MKRLTTIFHSPLSLDSTLEALRKSVDEERWTPFSWSGYRGESPLLGRIRPDSIRIRKRIFYNNGFARQFYGRLAREPSGTRIEGYFAGSVFTNCFLLVWWGALGAALIPILWRMAAGRGYESDERGLLLLIAMGTGAFVLVAFGRLLSRSGERFILEELREILNAAENDTPQSALAEDSVQTR